MAAKGACAHRSHRRPVVNRTRSNPCGAPPVVAALYIGETHDLVGRVDRHNDGWASRFTRSRGGGRSWRSMPSLRPLAPK
jgi:hypothetical protein